MPEMTEEQFTTEASAFLEANASRKAEQKAFVWGEGPDTVSYTHLTLPTTPYV